MWRFAVSPWCCSPSPCCSFVDIAKWPEVFTQARIWFVFMFLLSKLKLFAFSLFVYFKMDKLSRNYCYYSFLPFLEFTQFLYVHMENFVQKLLESTSRCGCTLQKTAPFQLIQSFLQTVRINMSTDETEIAVTGSEELAKVHTSQTSHSHSQKEVGTLLSVSIILGWSIISETSVTFWKFFITSTKINQKWIGIYYSDPLPSFYQ